MSQNDPSSGAGTQTRATTDDLSEFRAPPRAGSLALGFYLAGMTIGFGWLFAGYLIMRGRSEVLHLSLPIWFWLSTFLVLVSSVTVQWAHFGAKAGHAPTVRMGLGATLALGLMFLLSQIMGFTVLLRGTGATGTQGGMEKIIFLMAALHGAHLLGGIVRLVMLAMQVRQGPAREVQQRHLFQMAVYWHYLTLVWMAMFALFVLTHGGRA